MEEAVKKVLGTKLLKDTGIGGGGCISAGSTYLTDTGSVFVKVNHEKMAKEMFEGEKAGLEAILATKTIRVPKPFAVIPFGSSSCALVMESVKMNSLNSKTQSKLGEQLAHLHQHNILLVKRKQNNENCVTSKLSAEGIDIDDEGEVPGPVFQFGFHTPTSCGYIQQTNIWEDDWTTFFIRQKLEFQVNELLKKGRDMELVDIWDPCRRRVEVILNRIKPIPSLLHGDLWSGNASSVENEPIIYDPAAFYGHSEYDFGIAHMFGGFSKNFYDAYNEICPQQEGFHERLEVYELFHHLNHWNHFGTQYKRSSLRLMKSICSE